MLVKSEVAKVPSLEEKVATIQEKFPDVFSQLIDATSSLDFKAYVNASVFKSRRGWLVEVGLLYPDGTPIQGVIELVKKYAATNNSASK